MGWDNQKRKIDRIRDLADVSIKRAAEQFALLLADQVDRSLITTVNQIAGNPISKFLW